MMSPPPAAGASPDPASRVALADIDPAIELIPALLDHPSDRGIAPLVGNARIERLVLPFAAGHGGKALGLAAAVSWDEPNSASAATVVKVLHAVFLLVLDDRVSCNPKEDL